MNHDPALPAEARRGSELRATSLRQRMVDVVWWAGTALLVLIAASALVISVDQLRATVGSTFSRSDVAFLASAAVLVIAGLVGLAIVVGLARRGHATLALAIGLVTLVIIRSIAVITIPTPLQTDWLDYHTVATKLAGGGAYMSARSPGWPFVLSLLYRIGGPDPLYGELANIVFALGTGILIYDLARRTMGGVAAAAALYLWAISPGPAMFVVALASEHLYTLLFVAAVAIAVRALGRGWMAWIPVGIALAVGQYVRPVGLVIVPAFLILPFLTGMPRRRAGASALTVLFAFAVVMAPAVAWQHERFGSWTLSTSNFDGFNLLVGLNVAHGGQYNRDDLALVGAATSTPGFRDRSYQLAFERLRAHPDAVLTLAVPKFEVMWGDATYGPHWTLAAVPGTNRRVTATIELACQVAYLIVVVLAAACMVIRRRTRDPVALLTVLCLGAIAASELLLEVQPRYHAAFEPLFCLLAGTTVAWLVDRFRRRPDAIEAPAPAPAASPDAISPEGSRSGASVTQSVAPVGTFATVLPRRLRRRLDGPRERMTSPMRMRAVGTTSTSWGV